MKTLYNYTRIYLSAVLLMVFSGCSDEFLDVNKNPNVAEEGQPNFLLSSAQTSIGGELAGNVLIPGMAEAGAVFARQRYNLSISTYALTGATFQSDWENLYSEGLKDLQAIIEIAEERENFGYLGIAKVLKGYTFHQLVDMFGDIPYSEALQGEFIVSPRFDPAAEVYDGILSNLDEAIANLDTAAARGNVIAGDLMYGGNYDRWVRAANTLKLKMYLNIGNVDQEKAVAGINKILDDGRLITAHAHDWQLNFTTSQVPVGRHPVYRGEYDRDPGYLDNFFMLRMVENDDPRIRYYFYRQAKYNDLDFQTTPCSSRTDCATWDQLFSTGTNYIGRDHGDPSGLPGDANLVTVVGLYPWGGKFDNSSYRTVNQNSSNAASRGAEGAGFFPFFTSSMTHFMLAEAALRFSGVDTPMSAEEHFEAGMDQSFRKVRSYALQTLEASNIGTFEAAQDINYADASDNYIADRVTDFQDAGANQKLNLVMIEKNIAAWGNGLEPYTDLRRTGFPNDLPASLAPQGPFPLRMVYPDSEISANPNSPEVAPSQGVPVFWDNN